MEYDIILVRIMKEKVMFMKDIEQIIRKVDGNMSIEGMPLKEEDKQRIRECLTGKVSFDEMAKRLVKKHTIKL